MQTGARSVLTLAIAVGVSWCIPGRRLGTASQAAQQADTNGIAELQEVVVTATRHSDSVNRVPLSVSAQTQRRSISKASRRSRTFRRRCRACGCPDARHRATPPWPSAASSQSGTSATTGFYLDETALQKRAAGGFGSQNGTPVPPLFDLERVEVLRGPQGTLFGGGSEGGTIRYIQPAPSLTDYSGYGRAQWLTTQDGAPSYEAGAAFGGPIVENKLGFRASVFARKTGGYIDLTDYRNGKVYDPNSNSGSTAYGTRCPDLGAVRHHTIDALVFQVRGQYGQPDHQLQPARAGAAAGGASVLQHSVHPLPPGPGPRVSRPSGVLPVNPGCNANTGAYVAPGYTVGPFNPQRYQSLALGPSPTKTGLDVRQRHLSMGCQRPSAAEIDHLVCRRTSTAGRVPQNFPLTLFVYPGTARIVIPGQPPDSRSHRLRIQSERHLRPQWPWPRRVDRDQHAQPAQCALAGDSPRLLGGSACQLRRRRVFREYPGRSLRNMPRLPSWASSSWRV